MNCAIAYVYHAARGDDVSKLKCDESVMRNHLLNCYNANYLSPFPLTNRTVNISKAIITSHKRSRATTDSGGSNETTTTQLCRLLAQRGV